MCHNSLLAPGWLTLAPLLAGVYSHPLHTSMLMLTKHTCLFGLQALCRPALTGHGPPPLNWLTSPLPALKAAGWPPWACSFST